AARGRHAADQHELVPVRRRAGQAAVSRDRRAGRHRLSAGSGRADPAAGTATVAHVAARPRPARAVGLRPVDRRDEPGVLHVAAHDPAGHRGGAGVHRAAGAGPVWFAPIAGLHLDSAGGGGPAPAAADARAGACARSGRRAVRAGRGRGLACYIVLGQRAGSAHGGDAVTWGTSIAALVAIPVGVVHAGSALFNPALLPFALGVAVLSSALPYSLEMVALTRLPTRSFGTLLSLEPAIAALAGVALLGEHLSLLQWLAIAAIIVAAAGTALSVRKPVAEPLVN